MKHCRKDPDAPVPIEAFRTAKPTGSWDEFKDADRDGYNLVVERLGQDQRGLCAFCELDVSENNRQVAHFHPKSDSAAGTNWGLEWSNMWLCCKGGTQTWLIASEEYTRPLPQNRSCDENKTDRVLDGLILRPSDVPAFPRIFRYEQLPIPS